ncbi:MAG: hypothetical protein WD317_00195 [Balneolaceae bacterium]
MIIAQTAVAQDAQDRNFGIGGAVAGPDGISYKVWMNESAALAGLVSFSLTDYTSDFYTHLDYLVHKFYDDLDWEVGRLHYYYGGGIGYQWRDSGFDDLLMIRTPAGFGFNFEEVPVDLFFELAPTVHVSPAFNFHFNGNIGFRFYVN